MSESNQHVSSLPMGRWEGVQISMTHTASCKSKGQTGDVKEVAATLLLPSPDVLRVAVAVVVVGTSKSGRAAGEKLY